MEVGSFDHQNVSSPRGGGAVHHGCAMSTMSYFTFAMIAVYTAINANNVRSFFTVYVITSQDCKKELEKSIFTYLFEQF